MKLYPKVPKPIIYFSGTGTHGMTEQEMVDAGAKFRCFSHAYVCPGGMYYQKKMEEALDFSVKKHLGIMMDSGAHSFHKLINIGLRKSKGKFHVRDIDKMIDRTLLDLSKFYKKNSSNWDWYITFDYMKDCPTIRLMQKKLEHLGTKPVPVYHGDKGLDWMKKYIDDGHKLICIGSVRRNDTQLRFYYDEVFNLAEKHNIFLHGLAVTSLARMFSYPWYSVDSATWAKVAAFGCILKTSDSVNDTFGYVHLTNRRHGQDRGLEYGDMSPEQKKIIRGYVEGEGFDLKKLIDDGSARSLFNIHIFANRIRHLKANLAESHPRWNSLLV